MPTLYIMPADLVSHLEKITFSLNASKLVHALICHAHLMADGDPSLLWSEMNRSTLVRTSFIRDHFGWASQKSNRPIQNAMEDPSLKKILRHFELTTNSRAICRTFQSRSIEAAKVSGFDPANKSHHKYALLDAAQIAQCRSSEAVRLYVRCAMHRRQNFPLFVIPGVGNGDKRRGSSGAQTQVSEWQASPRTSWTEVRGKWLRAAANVAEITGDTIFLRVEEGLLEPGVSKVQVLLVNHGTKWKASNLFKSPPGVRYTEVTPESFRALSQAEVKCRSRGSWHLDALQSDEPCLE